MCVYIYMYQFQCPVSSYKSFIYHQPFFKPSDHYHGRKYQPCRSGGDFECFVLCLRKGSGLAKRRWASTTKPAEDGFLGFGDQGYPGVPWLGGCLWRWIPGLYEWVLNTVAVEVFGAFGLAKYTKSLYLESIVCHNSSHCATVYDFRCTADLPFFTFATCGYTCVHSGYCLGYNLLSSFIQRPTTLSPTPFCLKHEPLEKIQRLEGLLGQSPGRIWPRILLQTDLYLIPRRYSKLFHNMAAKATWYRPSVRSCMVRMETDLLKVHILPTKSSSCWVDQVNGLGEGRSCLSWNSIS